MWKKTLALVIVALIAVSAGAEVWKDKSYKDWDERDVRKVLSDSPWARHVTVNAAWRAVSRTDSPAASVPPLSAGSSEECIQEDGSSVFRSPAELESARADFVILWTSSRTVRTAMARGAVLRGTAEESDAERYLAQQPENYQVLVQGADMTPFLREDEAGLQKKAVLASKSSDRKLSPASVVAQRSSDGKRITAVAFYFPRNDAQGEPVIAPDEKSIEFRCEAGGVTFRANFQPQKMTDKNGVDL